jgi:hypothetical protein
MFVTELALVSRSERISTSQLTRVAAALQKQAFRDFHSVWGIRATVDAFEFLEDVPIGYWPIVVEDHIGVPGAGGVHEDDHGQPFALVEFSPSWSLTASHEMLEMLADPWGNRLVAGNSIKPDQGRVEFLVEVSDPCEAPQFAYTVNGYLVSDFLTPPFWDPVRVPGVRYSFTGAIEAPRKIREGGYISWHDPVTDVWWQQIWFGTPGPRFRRLGRMTNRVGSIRSAVDSRNRTSQRVTEMGTQSEELVQAREYSPRIKQATASRAEGWSARIDRIMAGEFGATWEDAGDMEGEE